MAQLDQQKQLIKIGNLVASRLNAYEILLVLIAIAGVILKIKAELETGILITLSLTILAVLYFFSSYALPDDENIDGLELFLYKLASSAGSITVIGILFYLENWAGYDIMTILGCTTLIIVLLAIIILKSKKPQLKLFNRRLIIRIIVLTIIGSALYFTPKTTMKKLGMDKIAPVERTN